MPTDYSKLSFRALRGAVALADSLESEITLLHVIELHGSPLDDEPREKGKDHPITSITGKLADKLEAWTLEHPEFELSLKRDGAQLQLISTRGGGEKRSKLKICSQPRGFGLRGNCGLCQR